MRCSPRGASYQVDTRESQRVRSSSNGAAGPTWMPPSPYGSPAAIDSMGSVAAPLLAGFSMTLLILVITSPGSFRWPGPVLVAFSVSAVALVSVVQFTFWARSYTVTPDELKSWWPDVETEERRSVVRGEQLAHEQARRIWSTRARRFYRAGIIA